MLAAMAGAKPFVYICGNDDFLVNRAGQERFDEWAKEVTDEFSREVLSGFANNVAEVGASIARFRESVQTVSMFGGRRLVWLKDVNFLADTVTGRAESTLALLQDLQELLGGLNPDEVAVLVTASPVDRRRTFPKWCEKNGEFLLVGGDGEGAAEALAGVVMAEARAHGVSFGEGALELLLAKVGANTRLLLEEVRKLAAYAGDAAVIEEAHVAELTPNVAEGDFFEAAEAFFSGNLVATLAALQRHFFSGGDSRPLISALQNRNRILLQLRALLDAGQVRIGPRGLDKSSFDRAAATYAQHYVGVTEKSSYNLFTQNPWYLGKLAGMGRLPSIKRLIDNQHEFINAFETILERPDEQEEVMREMVVRCLSTPVAERS